MRISDEDIQEREKQILDLLQQKKRITVKELADYFKISGSTIRRQVCDMEQQGKLIRTYGGIVRVDDPVYEEDIESKMHIKLSEKREIAMLARKFVKENDIICIGPGSTTLEFAKLLYDAKNLTVITYSITIANELYQYPDIEVQIVGGTIRNNTGAVVGPQASSFIDSIHVDKCFQGADSISVERGITTPSQFEVDMERRIIHNSSTKFVLADYSKFNRVTLAKVASLNEIDYIITDSKTSREYLDEIEKAGTKVVYPGK